MVIIEHNRLHASTWKAQITSVNSIQKYTIIRRKYLIDLLIYACFADYGPFDSYAMLYIYPDIDSELVLPCSKLVAQRKSKNIGV